MKLDRDECPDCGHKMTVEDERVSNGGGHHGTLFKCSVCGEEVVRG